MWSKSPAFALVGIGFSLAFWIGGSAVLGNYLDGRFGTEPRLTLILLVFGLLLGFYDAYRRLRDFIARTNPPADRKGPE
jgi:F0F1-type ATP synthase assembly protein I